MAMNWPFEENALENQLSSYLPTYDGHCFFLVMQNWISFLFSEISLFTPQSLSIKKMLNSEIVRISIYGYLKIKNHIML